MTAAASAAIYGFDSEQGALALTAMISVAAFLEAVLAFCIGCKLFGGLMRLGLIPERVCLACARGTF